MPNRTIYAEIKETYIRTVAVQCEDINLSDGAMMEILEEEYLHGESTPLVISIPEDYTGNFEITKVENPTDITVGLTKGVLRLIKTGDDAYDPQALSTVDKEALNKELKDRGAYSEDDLGIVMFTESHKPDIVRYYAVGVPADDGTMKGGILHDYLGGGVRDDSCVLDGKVLLYDEFEDSENRLNDVMGDGFYDLCYDYLSKFTNYDEEQMEHTIKNAPKEGRTVRHGKEFEPVEFGLTVWKKPLSLEVK